MDVITAIKTRYSVRSYQDKPVAKTDLDQIFETVRFSQSAGNRQGWKFVVVQDKKRIAEVVEKAKMQEFAGQAPVLIACCATHYTYVMRCGQNNAPIDVSIAMENLALAAHALGLGCCWFGSFDQQPIKQLLNIPEHAIIIGMMTLGHPAAGPQEKVRKALSEIVAHETWEGK